MIPAKAAVPLLVAILGVAAIAAIILLQHRAIASDDREDALQQIKIEVNQLGNVPFLANDEPAATPSAPASSCVPASARSRSASPSCAATTRRLRSPTSRARLPPTSAGSTRSTRSARRAGTTGRRPTGWPPAGQAQRAIAGKQLDAANRVYDQRAQKAIRQAGIGTAVAILLLLAAFNYFYRRYTKLLDVTRKEALTDSLTGLQNRRALIADLERDIPAPGSGRELMLALFDLDGFKQYNDTFGHAAGDALLAQAG